MTSDEVIVIEVKVHVEDGKQLNLNSKSQLSRTLFPEKYGSLALYDEDLENRFIIDHEELQVDKNAGLVLIGITEQPDG